MLKLKTHPSICSFSTIKVFKLNPRFSELAAEPNRFESIMCFYGMKIRHNC